MPLEAGAPGQEENKGRHRHPPALCLSTEEFTCRENQIPPQLHMDSDGERDAAPAANKRIMSRRTRSRYPLPPATRTSPLERTPTPSTPTTTATSHENHCHRNINPPPSTIDLCLRVAEHQTPELGSTDRGSTGREGGGRLVSRGQGFKATQ